MMPCVTVRGASPHRELADAVHRGERHFATQRSRGRCASLREAFCHTCGTVMLGMSIQGVQPQSVFLGWGSLLKAHSTKRGTQVT